MEIEEIRACPRGHRYRSSPLLTGEWTTCPRCDHLVLVSLVYGDCQTRPRGCRSLNFRSEMITDPQEACEILALPGKYNGYCGPVVWQQLGPVFPKLIGIEFGRESSPVVYAHLPVRRHQQLQDSGPLGGTPISEAERNAIAKEFVDAMQRAGADELSIKHQVARAWWD